MITQDKVIEELVSMILMQDKEIKRLQKKINRITQYLEVYEEYLEGADNSKWQR